MTQQITVYIVYTIYNRNEKKLPKPPLPHIQCWFVKLSKRMQELIKIKLSVLFLYTVHTHIHIYYTNIIFTCNL